MKPYKHIESLSINNGFLTIPLFLVDYISTEPEDNFYIIGVSDNTYIKIDLLRIIFLKETCIRVIYNEDTPLVFYDKKTHKQKGVLK